MKVLLIDNYDSFIYNLRYELNAQDIEVKVCRNDIDYSQMRSLVLKHDAIIISPGPSNPENAGHCLQLVKDFYDKKPILGICLGHQVIAQAMDASITHAKKTIHGKSSLIDLLDSALFSGLGNNISVARYHSLIAKNIPKELTVTATSEVGEVMAIEHKDYPIFGLQFHPESIMTLKGSNIFDNFKAVIKNHKTNGEISHVANA
ncbi:aminodeoxychorismate/anthranilate synthase component II [Kangiella sp. HZ709]|uniref:anthranilate synthase component II n=1 Tax=Kangiella sp. HZ709 TaxID=2666328 RepID=UPI0012AFAEE1|nr:aminodeoxychorismate/anthranilate synthase component II [Kangiella sp. HZ709]MRX27091.1 aminodeoxychorismate/anthranilate synthase component II [Kangiella sp. HZ709]